MSEVKKTKNYEMFKKNEANRPIDPSNLKRLLNSIKTQNMLEYRPIIVDSKFRVLDGQHRLEAAKSLGMDIYYQVNVEAEDKDMILLNTIQKRWALDDYVNYYVQKGYPEYIKYQEYARKKGISFMEIIRYLPRGGQFWHMIKNGKLKFPEQHQLQKFEDQEKKYKEFIPHIKKHILQDMPFIEGARFERALKMLIKNEDVDWDIFVEKATIKSDAFKICATAESYYLLFLDIYNWKNRNKVYPGVKKTPIPEDQITDQLRMT